MRKLIKKLKKLLEPERTACPLVGVTFNMPDIEHPTELMKLVGIHLVTLGARLKESPDADLHIYGGPIHRKSTFVLVTDSSGKELFQRSDRNDFQKIKENLTDSAHAWIALGWVGTNRPQVVDRPTRLD